MTFQLQTLAGLAPQPRVGGTTGTGYWHFQGWQGAFDVDSTGNIYFGGYCNDTGPYIGIVKCNSAGTVLWKTRLDQTTDLLGNMIAITALSTGGAAIAVFGINTSVTYQVFIISNTGTVTASKHFWPTDSAVAGFQAPWKDAIWRDPSTGNILVTTMDQSVPGKNVVVAYNTSGVKQWATGFVGVENGNGCVRTAGGAYMTSLSWDANPAKYSLGLISAAGALSWEKEILISNSTYPYAGESHVVSDSSDRCWLFTMTWSNGTDSMLGITRFTSAGAAIDSYSWIIPNGDAVRALCSDGAGGVFASFQYVQNPLGRIYTVIVHFDSNANVLWARKIGNEYQGVQTVVQEVRFAGSTLYILLNMSMGGDLIMALPSSGSWGSWIRQGMWNLESATYTMPTRGTLAYTTGTAVSGAAYGITDGATTEAVSTTAAQSIDVQSI